MALTEIVHTSDPKATKAVFFGEVANDDPNS
jgi:hypothetical protein